MLLAAKKTREIMKFRALDVVVCDADDNSDIIALCAATILSRSLFAPIDLWASSSMVQLCQWLTRWR